MDKQMKRNKYCFGLGTVGRDGVYTLVSMYLITYLTEVVGLSNANLAAIGTLMVIFRVFDALKKAGLEAKLILQIHDELIVEAPEGEAQQVKALLEKEMVEAAEFAVPLVADAKIGKSWYDAKD